MFIHWKFVYKPENFPKFQSFFFFKNTPKYDKLSKISNISIKTMLELRTKFGNFGNFGNFGHISDGLRKKYSIRTQCCNLIGSEPLYIPCIANRTASRLRNWQILKYIFFVVSICIFWYTIKLLLTIINISIWLLFILTTIALFLRNHFVNIFSPWIL